MVDEFLPLLKQHSIFKFAKKQYDANKMKGDLIYFAAE